MTTSYDYIVVGSGAGGGPLAANLARKGFTVLLLEAGSDCGDRPSYQVPALHGMATEDKTMEWDYFVRHYTDDARQKLDSKYDPQRGGVWYPRAGTLGGCTAHNAMITVYPHNSDWDAVAALTGDNSWKAENMRKYFQVLERCEYLPAPVGSGSNPTRHGFGGWLTTSKADPRLAVKDPELIKTVATAALTVILSRVRDPKALVKWILAQADIGLDHIDGLLKLLLAERLDPAAAARALVEGSTDLIGRLLDPNDWQFVKNSIEGLCIVPLAVEGGLHDPDRKGHRNGPRDYLKAVQSAPGSTLTIETDALVARVMFDTSSPAGLLATGVEYLKGARLYGADPNRSRQPGEKRQALARREVILAAGAFNTPQILMLSGIGPADHLQAKGIKVLLPLPGVGGNLQDRYEVGVVSDLIADFSLLENATFQAPEPGAAFQQALAADPALKEWFEKGTGLYATNGAVIGIIMKSKPERPEPDLFIFGLPGYFKGYFQTYSADFEKRKNRFTWAILKAHTKNRAGSVRLRSANPQDVPEINFRYFDDGKDTSDAREDLESVTAGVRFVQQMTRLNRFVTQMTNLPGGKPIDLSGEVSDATIGQFIQQETWGHHACGTCPIGPRDQGGVLDSNFTVHGTKNLRVVDASVFPRIPGFFIVTPIYMVSEKATEAILSAAGRDYP